MILAGNLERPKEETQQTLCLWGKKGENIHWQFSVQSCIWQGKQLWQRYSIKAASEAEWTALLMCSTGCFVRTHSLQHETPTSACSVSHNRPLLPFPFDFVPFFFCWLRQTNVGVSCVYSVDALFSLYFYSQGHPLNSWTGALLTWKSWMKHKFKVWLSEMVTFHHFLNVFIPCLWCETRPYERGIKSRQVD